MNKKVSLGVTISLVAVACAITFVLTMTVSLNMYNSMVAGIQERETINAKIKEIDSFVRGFSIYELDESDILGGIMNGYISGVDDKYAKYYTADEYYKQQQIESGIIIGTGVETQINGDYLEITSVYSGSSADVAELSSGYTITAIDKKSILEIGAEKAQTMLDGEEGTKISLTVKAPDESEKDVTLVRQRIKLQSAVGQLVDGYAYIKIYTFNNTTSEQFIQLIDNFESQSVLGYIFDVRDVSDGIIEPLNAMLNRVLPKAVVATSENADGTEQTLIETDGLTVIEKPIAVITNGGTACAAELFAAGMRDFAGASIVGSVTAGKAELQLTRSFKDGSAVSISVARAYPTQSESFDDVGITPDYKVEITQQQAQSIKFADAESDSQLQKALEAVAAK